MFKAFEPGCLGIKTDFEGAVRLAKAHGFEGLVLGMGEAAKLGAAKVKETLESTGLRPAAWALPVDVRGDADAFRSELETLEEQSRLAEEIGCPRCTTWMVSFSDDLPMKENMAHHRARLGRCAEVLKDHGCRLGLEFLGPKTIRDGHRYEFIHTMAGMLELCDLIGTGNVGLLLDSWHWYTSRGTVEEIRALDEEQVVLVHVNDAPAGVDVDEQIDGVRALPGETGIVDVAGFLGALREIGYTGPVEVEPFSERVREMQPEDAARATAEALDGVWKAAGV